MKTSKKILITVAGIIIAFLIAAMFVLKKDVKSLMESKVLVEYKTAAVEKFVSLDFSSSWIVTIKQGKNCKVEFAVDKNADFKPELKNLNGVQYIGFDVDEDQENVINRHVRITAPFLHIIKASGDTKIQMKSFWTDSLTVILEDSSMFSGNTSDIIKITFKASAND